MAYNVTQLTAFFTNANAGTAPTAAQTLTLQALANQNAAGTLTNDQALASTVDLASDTTTAVSVGTYQFFLGYAPSQAGLTALNAAYVGTGSQAGLNGENRFIAQSVSLALQNPTAKASFAASYGTMSVVDATKAAYNIIIGNSAAAAAGVNVDNSVAFLTSATSIAYYTAFVKANVPGLTTQADIDLAVKAAIVGEILYAATTYNNGAGLGSYATASTNLIKDLADDGALTANNSAGVDLFGNYGPGGAGTTYTLITGADTITGTGSNDTINALTIKADGTNATTFSAFDSIDGGAGEDTLNIYVDDTNNLNDAFPTSAVVKNVEVVNILNANTAVAGLADASKYQGVQQLWQVNAAATVTNLGSTATAGFKNVDANVQVDTASAAASAKVALSGYGEGRTITVDGSASDVLASVSVSGTVSDTNSDGTVANTNLAVIVGEDVQSVSVSSAVATTVTIDDSGSTDKVTSVNLSGSTGKITFVGDTDVATITGGAGADTLTLGTTTAKDNAATSADETISAALNGGAGNDTITIATTGDGTTTVLGGAGNDTVTHTSHGTGKLTVDLGDGDDKFLGAGVVSATDVIDGGAGTDTLRLSVVGAANIGAFSNFERFDVVGLNTTLDVDILASKNTVTEIVGSGALGGASTLTNLGAGVGFRATATGITGLTLTQKTAGPLAVTVDTDAGNDAGVTASTTSLTASNATSLSATFAADHGDTAANTATLALTGTKATSLTVVSGGTNVSNTLNYTAGAASSGVDLLATATISGAKALTFDVTYSGANKESLATLDASAMTGALTFNMNDLKASTDYSSVVKLGSGDDSITMANGGAIQGIELGTAEDATVVSNFDVLKIAGGIQGADVTAATYAVKDGLLTFLGTGPTTLADAIATASTAVAVNGVVVFEYLGNSYVFAEGADNAVTTDDVVVKLVGVTGLHGADTVATGSLYVF